MPSASRPRPSAIVKTRSASTANSITGALDTTVRRRASLARSASSATFCSVVSRPTERYSRTRPCSSKTARSVQRRYSLVPSGRVSTTSNDALGCSGVSVASWALNRARSTSLLSSAIDLPISVSSRQPFEPCQRRVGERHRQVGVVAGDPLGLEVDDRAVQLGLVAQRPVRLADRLQCLSTRVCHAIHRHDGRADEPEEEQQAGRRPGGHVVDEPEHRRLAERHEPVRGHGAADGQSGHQQQTQRVARPWYLLAERRSGQAPFLRSSAARPSRRPATPVGRTSSRRHSLRHVQRLRRNKGTEYVHLSGRSNRRCTLSWTVAGARSAANRFYQRLGLRRRESKVYRLALTE